MINPSKGTFSLYPDSTYGENPCVPAQKRCALSVCLSLTLSVCLQVQLQLLTAIVKLFLKKPTETQELVQQVLSLATQVGRGSRARKELPWASRQRECFGNAAPVTGGR